MAPLQPPNDAFSVVGIGASAGGLDAFRTLLDALPADAGIALVLISHLAPNHASMLVNLLSSHTTMPVAQAANGMPLERNHVYVIAPQTYLSVRNGALEVSAPLAPHGARLPFDFFLNSLAEEYGERAICVVLSGTGADGSIGLQAVSEQGGLVIAQDPDEAAFDGMPRSAIGTGAVNLVLPSAQIPQAIVRYARHPYVTGGPRVAPRDGDDEALATITELLRERTSRDFTHYRKPTLLRRTRRRMATAGIEDIAAYVDRLREDGARGRTAREGLSHSRDQLLPQSGGLRGAGADGHSRVGATFGSCADPGLGRGLQHRGGSLFARHAVRRGVRRRQPRREAADLCLRH